MNGKIILCVVTICLIILSGCVNVPEEPAVKISNSVILIGDSPIEDFKHVNLTFSEVKLYSNIEGWINIPLEVTTLDLLYLHRNNLTQTLAMMELEIGTYTQFQIAFRNATGITTDGNMVYFNLSSNILRFQHMFKFGEGTNTVSVDMNLTQSIHLYKYENENLYKLQPVVSELNVSYANGTMIRFRERERIITYDNGTQIRLQDENTLQNMIVNRKPTIDVVVNGKRGSTFQFKMNESIMFNASETFDVDNDPLSFSWEFGDNTSGTGAIITHMYASEGTYQIRLRVSDMKLDETMTLIVIIINPGHPGNETNPP